MCAPLVTAHEALVRLCADIVSIDVIILRGPKRRWRVELLVQTILEKGGAKVVAEFQGRKSKTIFQWRRGEQKDRPSSGRKLWRETKPQKEQKRRSNDSVGWRVIQREVTLRADPGIDRGCSDPGSQTVWLLLKYVVSLWCFCTLLRLLLPVRDLSNS